MSTLQVVDAFGAMLAEQSEVCVYSKLSNNK